MTVHPKTKYKVTHNYSAVGASLVLCHDNTTVKQ
uniref:Uncharacterized protein n=1 Tax=Anguilla anguilla TaxID=7936 RepID=A0A0E9Q1L3_ANGAN